MNSTNRYRKAVGHGREAEGEGKEAGDFRGFLDRIG